MSDPKPTPPTQSFSFRPSVFYRREHPDYFSDTTEVEDPVLPKDLLLFHLDQLTTARKEREFEDFCRRLAQHEICPNLLPQTGPVGGGDSKTDASTYPVANELAQFRCWAGHTGPSNEDWAFAFSAKRDWRAKVKDDIAKIAAVPRRYRRVYFITNQPVKDKTRAQLEASLSKQHDFDVRILDRTWIAERVVTNHHEMMAIETLALQVSAPRARRLGPQDATRTKLLETLLTKLRASIPGEVDSYIQSQDYLRAAKLASSLERPRDEADGLFVRARDLALASGHVPAIVRTHYQHAWRSHFWYDDSVTADRILEIILPYLPELQEAELCELYNNLCTVLEIANATGFYRQDDAVLQSRRDQLTKQLKRLAADYARPNNALYAETILVSAQLPTGMRDPGKMEQVFVKLTKLFRRAQKLGTYPLLQFVDTWEKLGEYYCDWPGYADLQREMQQITAKRFGDTEAGRRQITFGWQLLEKSKYAEALQALSQGRFLLTKEETLDESVDAALGCAVAYRALGHGWAARMEAISAAHASLYSIERLHENPQRGLFVVMLIAGLELSLGRVAPFLAWHHFTQMMLLRIEALGYDCSREREALQIQDGCFACLLLKAPADEVRELRELADVFERIELFISRAVLLYVCGEKDKLEGELPAAVLAETDAVENMICGLKQQPAFEEAPSQLCRETRAMCYFNAFLLGVDYRVRCRNSIGPILIAESLLGMIDAAFATAAWENFAFVVDNVTFVVDESPEGQNPPSLKQFRFNILHDIPQVWQPDLLAWLHDHRLGFSDYLLEFLSTLVAAITIDAWADLKRELDNWHKYGVFDRALVATQNGIAFCDLIGKERYDINYWIKAAAAQEI